MDGAAGVERRMKEYIVRRATRIVAFNDFLQSIMIFGVLLILVTLPLSVYTAYAHDVQAVQRGEPNVTPRAS